MMRELSPRDVLFFAKAPDAERAKYAVGLLGRAGVEATINPNNPLIISICPYEADGPSNYTRFQSLLFSKGMVNARNFVKVTHAFEEYDAYLNSAEGRTRYAEYFLAEEASAVAKAPTPPQETAIGISYLKDSGTYLIPESVWNNYQRELEGIFADRAGVRKKEIPEIRTEAGELAQEKTISFSCRLDGKARALLAEEVADFVTRHTTGFDFLAGMTP